MDELKIEFCGEWFTIEPPASFTIGRVADLSVDDNPYLHRQFLQVSQSDGLWWLTNVGSRLSATVADESGGVQAWLSPGAQLPVVFSPMIVIFTAGPTTYELTLHTEEPTFATVAPAAADIGETTIGQIRLTPSQRVLIVALAEPMLRRAGVGTTAIPSSQEAATRLGWALTRFNRKLDNVCDKLDQIGVQGLRGGPGKLATNRRARLVEYAVSSRLVTAMDLGMLTREHLAAIDAEDGTA